MTRGFACLAIGAACVTMSCAQLIDIEDLPELRDSGPLGGLDAEQPAPDAGRAICDVSQPSEGAGEASCSGILIEHIPLEYEAQIYGYLDVYYDNATGFNCAMTRAVGAVEGNATWIEVALLRCIESSPGPVCTPDEMDSDCGPFRYYAGPVRVHAPGRCISARGTLGYDGQTVSAATSPAASRCGE